MKKILSPRLPPGRRLLFQRPYSAAPTILRRKPRSLIGCKQLSVLRLVKKITGVDVSLYRQSTISRRLQLRLQATGCSSLDGYIKLIQKDPQEAFNFQEHLLIHVTRFFRDKPVFTYLERRILPGLIENLFTRQRRTLRVWSIGCATGQEPFSLAMILYNLTRQRGIHPVILATDISAKVITQAREACFRPEEMRPIPRPFRDLHCLPQKRGGFRIAPNLRRMVVFHQHNLISDEPLGTFDLILCRNLLIFFKPEAHDFLLAKIAKALNDEGFLVLGRSESLNSKLGLTLVSSRFHVYQKVGGKTQSSFSRKGNGR